MDANGSLLLPPAEAKEGTGRRWLWPVLGIAGLLVLILGVRLATQGAKAAPPPRAVPVSTGVAKVGDMPVTLTGLGTVVPTDAVVVRTRVDGQILKIAFQEGQLVHQGDLLVQVDPRPFQVQLLQAEGQMAKDQASLKNARMDLERVRSLFAQKIVSQQQLDTQTALVDQVEASVKSDLGAVESAKLNLTYSRITAPLSGRVGLRLVDQGNMVKASDANGLVTLAPVSPINVLFTVPADSIQAVIESNRRGKAPVVEVFDRDMGHALGQGTLLAIDNQVDATTGTLRLKAQFANKDAGLFPNQFVNARLRVDTLKDAIQIPSAAVQRSPQGAYVYVVLPDSSVDLRMVEVLATDGEVTALKSGLKAGERVVINGLDKLRPGSKVLDDAKAPGKPEGKAGAQAGLKAAQ
jgi:multidrug efflux system membrane fusion protein